MQKIFKDSVLNQILSIVPDAVLVCDVKGDIIFCNPIVQNVLGYIPAELIGQKIEVLIPSALGAKHKNHRRNYQKDPHSRPMGSNLDLRAIKKDGSEILVEVALSPLKWQDKTLVFVLLRDISQRVHRQILQTTETVQQTIGQDLHDNLGQQLTAASYLTRALEKKLLTQGLKQESQAAAEILNLLSESIAQVRQLARQLYPVELKVQGLQAALHNLASNAQKNFGIKCLFKSAYFEDNFNENESTQFYRIVQEALNNALKHAKAQTIQISIKVVTQKGQKKYTISVQDDGCGIPLSANNCEGLGLRIMRYRAASMGAVLEVLRLRQGGTKIVCALIKKNEK